MQTFLQVVYPYPDLISSAPDLPAPGAPLLGGTAEKGGGRHVRGPLGGKRESQIFSVCLHAAMRMSQYETEAQILKS